MRKTPKLFAVYPGGRAPRRNTELHDVAFAGGDTIEETYEQLLDKWFGSPKGLHLDSWIELKIVDGHRVTLSPTPVPQKKKLFFINLVRIALGRGVCSAVAQCRETILVPDVTQFPGHIACDHASRSEIVLPLIKDAAPPRPAPLDRPPVNASA